MKLGIFNSLGTTLFFGLRHFPAFYLLCLLAGLPRYLHSLLPYANWQSRLIVSGVEVLLVAFFTAAMAWTLVRDLRGESWSVLPGLGDAFERLPNVLGVGFVVGAVTVGLSYLGVFLATLHPLAAALPSVAHFILAVIFCLAVPLSALGEEGIFDCFRRSAALTAGSRLRIVAIYVLAMVPVAVGLGFLLFVFAPSLRAEAVPPLLILLGASLANTFLFALPVIIHAQLTELQEGPAPAATAAVFD